jgi:hypothetical protein
MGNRNGTKKDHTAIKADGAFVRIFLVEQEDLKTCRKNIVTAGKNSGAIANEGGFMLEPGEPVKIEEGSRP